MSGSTLVIPFLKRELHGLLAHWMFAAGMALALAAGISIALVAGDGETGIWILYQLIYYILPLLSTLGTIMIVRQDLCEGPLLALLPGATPVRVLVKGTVATGYFALTLLLLVVPSLLMGDGARILLLGLGGGLVILAFVSIGVWSGYRFRHEVRAYLGALFIWFTVLFGSGFVAYAAHGLLSPEVTPVATLITLMVNPLESFRIFVFFGLSAMPMNPQSLNPVVVWWMDYPLAWLSLVALVFAIILLVCSGWNLRFRAHGME